MRATILGYYFTICQWQRWETDNDSSLQGWSQSILDARGMWSPHCPVYTSQGHKSFLEQRVFVSIPQLTVGLKQKCIIVSDR